MALNSSTLTDENGDYSDWIEIYNNSSSTVNLAGWFLTDNSNDLTQWEFPATNLAAGGYLLVFASGKDRAISGDPLHANFSLKGSGEYLGLVDPDGATVVSKYSPKFPSQYSDVSYGFGIDPMTSVLVAAGAACRVHVPASDVLGSNWIFRTGFDDSSWTAGVTGVGFDLNPDFIPLIGMDVSNLMYGIHPTIYIRIPFTLDDASGFSSLLLNIKYDDGFFAYLNGEEIARRFSPEEPAWNAIATNYHDDAAALVYEPINLPDSEELLTVGTNVLALLAMNNNPSSSDLLFMPELLGRREQGEPSASPRYFEVPTPGTENGVGTADLGPLIRGVTNAPAVPAENQNLLVTAEISKNAWPVDAVRVYYRVMYSNEVALMMKDDGLQDDGILSNGIYGASIPASAYTTGQMVRFAVEAVDNHGTTSRWPLASDTAEYEGTVVSDPTLTNALPVFYWFVPVTNWYVPPQGTNRTWSLASAYFRGKFYDNIQVRVRGQTAGDWVKPPFKFEFNKGRYFDYVDGAPLAEEINLNSTLGDKAFVRPVLGYESYRDAGSYYCETFPLRIQQNGKFYSVAVFVEQPGESALEYHGLDPNGALYKIHGGNPVVSSTEWVTKVLRKNEPHDDLQALVDGVSLTNSQTSRSTYTFDNVDIPSVLNYLAVTMIMHDRDCFWKNFYLYRDTEGTREWSFLPWDKDLTYGRNWTSNWEGVLNDYITFIDPPVQGTFNLLVGAVLENPRILKMYGRRCRTLMDQLLQAPGTAASNLYYETRIAGLATQMSADVALDRAKWPYGYGTEQSFSQALTILTNEYLLPRRYSLYVTNHVSHGGIIPDAQTNSPLIHFGAFEFSPASGNQDEEYIQLVNSNAVDVDLSGWSLTGAVQFTFSPGTVLDAGGIMYVSPAPAAFRARSASPKGGEDRFVVGPCKGHLSAWGERVDLLDANSGAVNSATYEGNPSDLQKYLRITEIMYDPPEGGSYEDGFFEYIEFKNLWTNSLDVSGVRFSGGFAFSFTNGVTNLAPGAFLVLVRNREAFATRYDTNGLLITGEYDGRLSNNGEELKLEDPNDETILEFRYSDAWYTNTDGGGYSLTVRAAAADHNTWGESNQWRSSVFLDGSPGWDDSGLVDEDMDGVPDTWEVLFFGSTNADRGGPDDDFDEDGTPNGVEYVAGTCPTNEASDFCLDIAPSDSALLVHFSGLAAEGDNYVRKQRRYRLEETTNLQGADWTAIAGYTNTLGENQPVVYTNTGGALNHFRVKAWIQ